MFLTRSEYDRGVNTFSPEGRLFQVEYAIEAIKLGSTSIGIQINEGVVLAVEKRVGSTLLIPSSIQKILEIDSHVGAAMSGLTADANTLIEHSRIETQNYWFTYNDNMRVESVAQSVCDLALGFGGSEEKSMARPFGVSLLIAGVDKYGAHLYQTDPSGAYVRYNAKSIGAGSEAAQLTLQEQYNKSMTIAEAQKLALSVLKQVMEEKLTASNVELATITVAEGKFRVASRTELEAMTATLETNPLHV